MGFALYVLALGATLSARALITIIKPVKYAGCCAPTVTDTVWDTFMTLMLFSGFWIIFVEVFKALG